MEAAATRGDELTDEGVRIIDACTEAQLRMVVKALSLQIISEAVGHGQPEDDGAGPAIARCAPRGGSSLGWECGLWWGTSVDWGGVRVWIVVGVWIGVAVVQVVC